MAVGMSYNVCVCVCVGTYIAMYLYICMYVIYLYMYMCMCVCVYLTATFTIYPELTFGSLCTCFFTIYSSCFPFFTNILKMTTSNNVNFCLTFLGKEFFSCHEVTNAPPHYWKWKIMDTLKKQFSLLKYNG